MTDLIAALERGPGSRELDFQFVTVIGKWKRAKVKCGGRHPPYWAYWRLYKGKWIRTHLPHYTTNLQDAVDAVPEGLSWLVRNDKDGGGYAHLSHFDTPYDDLPEFDAHAPAPARALCIAIAKAGKGD